MTTREQIKANALYVKTEKGLWLVQVQSDNQWGFTLLSEDQGWDGGFGIAQSWEVVGAEKVPARIKRKLETAIDDYASNLDD